jgi:hypothetical protein
MMPPAYVWVGPQTGDGPALEAAKGNDQALIPNRSTQTPSGLPWWVIAFVLIFILILVLR